MKRLISIFLVIIITMQFLVMNISAEKLDKDYAIPNNVQYEIDVCGYGEVICKEPLYNYQNEIIAYCIEFNNAYLIFDVNGNVMEHSPETNSPFYNLNKTAYYGGPLVYCYKDDSNNFIKITDGEIVSNSFLVKSEDFFSNREIESASSIENVTRYSTGYNVETYYTDYAPYCLDCNTDGTCGVVAATILFMYYHQYIHNGFANAYFMNSPVSFHNYLLNNYLPETCK